MFVASAFLESECAGGVNVLVDRTSAMRQAIEDGRANDIAPATARVTAAIERATEVLKRARE